MEVSKQSKLFCLGEAETAVGVEAVACRR